MKILATLPALHVPMVQPTNATRWWPPTVCGPKLASMIHDDGDPVCSQFVAYRGTIPIEEAPPDSEFDAMVLWVGPDLHFVQYVVHHGTLFNQVAVFRSYRYTPDSDDWGNVAGTGRALQQNVPSCPRGGREDKAQSPLAHAGPPAYFELDAQPDHSSRRCGASHAAIPRAGSVSGFGRCPLPGKLPEEFPSRYSGRLPKLSGAAHSRAPLASSKAPVFSVM